jgi:hypothetical protein
MSRNKKFEEAIKNTCDAILDSVHKEGVEKQDSLEPFKVESVLKSAIKGKDPEEYFYGLEYNIRLALDSFVKTHFSFDPDVVFLFRNYYFVERSFQKLFQKFEGHTCSADKSRTIMVCLVRFYLKGKPIAFDYDQKYTYHLPDKIFKDHDQIVTFYQALRRLWYGNGESYLQWFVDNASDLTGETNDE